MPMKSSSDSHSSAQLIESLLTFGTPAITADQFANPLFRDADSRKTSGDHVTEAGPGVRVGDVCFVNGDCVAVLAHDARGDFLPCVATLGGPLFQVMSMADNHGSGLQLVPAPRNCQPSAGETFASLRHSHRVVTWQT